MAARAGPRDVHDRLWKRVFSRKAAFAVELRRMLPPELLAHLDLGTLARYPTERIDERLHGRISDLCFTADFIDGERRLPAIFPAEHYSTPTPSFPLRAIVSAGEILYEHLAEHPHAKVFPLIVPLVFTQPGAQGTPTQLSTILDVPPQVRERFPSPIEVRAYVDDFSGSVLDDPYADPATLALVELTRAFLYAYDNPSSLTPARLAVLAPLFDVLLDQPEPLAAERDVHALLTYVLRAFPKGSPVRALVENALPRRPRKMFISIADSLVAKGERRGARKGHRAGLSEGERRGLARAVLGVLEHRSVSIPEAVRRRVFTSRDEHQLQRWFDRAFAATTAEEIFDDLDG
jgi:Putative transposase, YhgA-like